MVLGGSIDRGSHHVSRLVVADRAVAVQRTEQDPRLIASTERWATLSRPESRTSLILANGPCRAFPDPCIPASGGGLTPLGETRVR